MGRVADRICLAVSNCNFPHFDRNSSAGGVVAQESLNKFQAGSSYSFPVPLRFTWQQCWF